MYVVGYIDDKIQDYSGYLEMFKRFGIELFFCDDISSKEKILKWISENRITCVIADYDLQTKVDFTGNDLLNYLLCQVPDLPCIIFTSYLSQAQNRKNVPSLLVFEKDVLSNREKRKNLFEQIKNCSEIFSNRLEERQKRFLLLKEKRNNELLTNIEEEEFLNLYKFLNIYLDLDDIPSQLLKSNIDIKLDQILNELNNLLDK